MALPKLNGITALVLKRVGLGLVTLWVISLLIFVGVGGMGLVALTLTHLFQYKDASWARRKAAYGLAGIWLFIHLILAPLLLPLRALYPSDLDAFMAKIDATLPKDEALGSRTLVVVNTPDFSLSFYLLMRRAALGEPLPGFIRFLSITAGENALSAAC